MMYKGLHHTLGQAPGQHLPFPDGISSAPQPSSNPGSQPESWHSGLLIYPHFSIPFSSLIYLTGVGVVIVYVCGVYVYSVVSVFE